MVLSRKYTGTWVPLILAVLSSVAVVDQISKVIVLNALEPGVPTPILGEWVRLLLVFNPGAAFSLGTEFTWVFTCIQLFFVGAVLIMAPGVSDRGIAWGLALIAGGAAGNLIDRLFRPPQFFLGHVVDFISIQGFAVFNIADSAITIGTGITVIALLVEGRNSPLTHTDAASSSENSAYQRGDSDE